MGFVFASCASDYVGHVKDDVARDLPALRLAYSRPGFLTFKIDDDVPPEVPRPSPWARVWGSSLGRVRSAADALALLPADARRLHVWGLAELDGDEAPVVQAEATLREADPERFFAEARARDGELVVDVIVAADGAWLVGLHRHGAGRSPFPGGELPVEVPADAPSRAYAKLEQAIAWAGLPVAAGHVAVEIGSAPGGAAYADRKSVV